MRVLVTRPLPQARRTANRLRQMGFKPILSPMLEVRRVREAAPLALDGVQALLVTSTNGARATALATQRRRIKVLTVGERTAEIMRNEGFESVCSAGGDAEDLGSLVSATLDPAQGALMHVRGRDVRRSPMAELSTFDCRETVVYAADPVEELTEDAETALESAEVAVLFYSARTTEVFDRLTADRDLQRLTAVGISERALAPLAERILAGRSISPHPTEDSLFATLKAANH